MTKHDARERKVSFIYFHLNCEIGNFSVYTYCSMLLTSWLCQPPLYAYFALFLFNVMKTGEFPKLMRCFVYFISVIVDKCR